MAEVMLSVGILALVLPWVHAAWRSASDQVRQIQCETASRRVIEAAMDHLRQLSAEAATAGDPSRHPLADGRALLCGFRADGVLLGPVARAHYDRGFQHTDTIEHAEVALFVKIEAAVDQAMAGRSLTPVQVTLEFPASEPARLRRKLVFEAIAP